MDEEDSDTMNMPTELARQLFEEGAILIIAGVPIETEFGIDQNTYQVGEKFRGVKMIPAGPHYVYTASQGPYGDSALRVGFIHYFNSQEILIREWDDKKEELRIRITKDPDLEIERIRDNLENLDSYLAAYDYQSLRKWKNLTEHITEETITKLQPECGIVKTSAEFESCPDAERPKGDARPSRQLNIKSFKEEEDYLPNLKVVKGTAPRFTILPDRCPKDATPAQVTLCYMDSIQAIDKLVEMFSNSIGLMDEIQFAFILYLCGCSVESLAHWRKILNIFANSLTAIKKHRDLYRKYLSVLQYQLPELPEEIMEMTPHNTVYKDIRSLIANCSLGGLSKEADYLSVNLNVSMEWSFDGILDEDPEDMPVIVET